MDKSVCIFGSYFRAERILRGLSIWKIVHRLNYYPANILRIETGIQHPGINMAFKLFEAIGCYPGELMEKIARENYTDFPHSLSQKSNLEFSYRRPVLEAGEKSLFGPMLLQARQAANISQTSMAKAAGYNLRNINNVEKGKQDPGIIISLALVMTTGVNIKEFYETLFSWWMEMR